VAKPKFYASSAFKELDAKWKAKLKKSGFDDIEGVSGILSSDRQELGRRRDYRAYDKRPLHYEAITEYYRLCGHFLHDHKFEDENERRVWELHGDGLSHRDIYVILKKKISRRNIQAILMRLEKVMLDKCISRT